MQTSEQSFPPGNDVEVIDSAGEQERGRSLARKRKRQRSKKKQAFTSKADSFELRNYQRLASMFPPLTHEEVLECSRTFIRARNNLIAAEECELIDIVLGGDWSDESLREHKAEVLDAYKAKIDWISAAEGAADIVGAILPEGQRTPGGLYAHRFDNIFERFVWEKPLCVADAYVMLQIQTARERGEAIAVEELQRRLDALRLNTFLEDESAIVSSVLEAVEERMPQAAPKDIIDRWKERSDQLDTRYMASVKSLFSVKKAVAAAEAIRAEHIAADRAEAEQEALARAAATGADVAPEYIPESEYDNRQLRIWQDIAEESLNRLVNHNLQLAMSRVAKIMKSNPRAQHIGAYDLIAAANLGLVLGARQFDPEMGRKFSTYAAFHIDWQLYAIVAKEDG
ncbi:MAG: hypothetical protein BZ138_07730, partial [Methanosphaera sp. rholeuAM270]